MDLIHHKTVGAQFDDLGNSGGDLAWLDTLSTPNLVNYAFVAGSPQGLEETREFLRSARRDTYGGRRGQRHRCGRGEMVVQFGPRELQWPGVPSWALTCHQA
jgi:hypothetical protein